MYWFLALLSISLAAAATTPTKPVATTGKAPVKVAAKAPPAPVKTAPKTTAYKAPAHSVATSAYASKPAPTVTTHSKVQPKPQQYSRYNASTQRNRRQMATARTYSRPKPVYHPAQATPTPDRYKEIQSALVSRGYLHSEPTGAWDAESTEAMKRFQKDQNLDSDGKLNALSIIALGLGPKRTVSATAGVVPPPAASVNPPAAGASSSNSIIPAPPRN
jgi:murein L,D-transpeptidase YcbB/YkuD